MDDKQLLQDAASLPTTDDRSLAAYDYFLPEDLIAQNPVTPRDSARLLVVLPKEGHAHRIFRDLPELLQPGDLLVLNNTRVIRARLYGRKISGASVEVLLLEERQNNTWLALVRPGKRLLKGAKIIFDPPSLSTEAEDSGGRGLRGQRGTEQSQIQNILSAKVLAVDEATGGRILEFDIPEGKSLTELLDEFGNVPLPPYITNSQALPEQYQTVYGSRAGSAAAPTAGLHFTEELLERLQQRGIERTFVTLHIGVGTFRPVEVEDVTQHKMHEEWVEVSPETVAKIRATKERGGRVIAVGTTSVRSLEAAAAATGQLQTFCGKTDLFIYPGYQWRVVDGLMTNFHLPRSSLLMLVSALVGRQRLLDLYTEAIAHNYRFYSFGDAMLILPTSGNG
ncbi:MAG TPA: tRNA preQ1(34) S-adenosylmethionine ribosyltransferase-isomerase QueA [Cyanobacteria bacterium UBA11372]|nr:tRNA preQ1(34) S-adenosylmethionine ribosyltransferase-isomerase QueA [Cyanobacteria bacterium UBA11372]